MKAEEIKKLRESLNMTLEEFAYRLSASYTTVSRWENGHNVPSKLYQREINKLREKYEVNICKRKSD